MKTSSYKTYDDLPLFLNAEQVAAVLGVASSSAYELLHQLDFPALRIGKRIVVPKEKFIQFPLPNEISVLGLSPGKIPVYAYLLFYEDGKNFQCWPSCRSIGRAAGMSVNTVRKYIRSLETKGFITTEPTTITDKGGRKRNGNLLFTIRLIGEMMERFYAEQLTR